MRNTDKLAVLIDADNAQASIAEELLNEIARYGTATVRRAFGDWTTPNLNGWKEVLHQLAIQPMQQFRFTTGKNATDSALIIDAMDFFIATRWTDSVWFHQIATSLVLPPASEKPATLYMVLERRRPRSHS